MNAHFDLKAGEIVSPWILRDRAEKEEQRRIDEINSYPYKPVSDKLMDDWTGDKWAKWPLTYGREPYPPYAKNWKKSKHFVQLDDLDYEEIGKEHLQNA